MPQIDRQYQAYANLRNAVERMRQEKMNVTVSEPYYAYTPEGIRKMYRIIVDVSDVVAYEEDRNVRPAS